MSRPVSVSGWEPESERTDAMTDEMSLEEAYNALFAAPNPYGEREFTEEEIEEMHDALFGTGNRAMDPEEFSEIHETARGEEGQVEL